MILNNLKQEAKRKSNKSSKSINESSSGSSQDIFAITSDQEQIFISAFDDVGSPLIFKKPPLPNHSNLFSTNSHEESNESSDENEY